MYPVNVMPSKIGSLVNLLDQKKKVGKDMKQTLLYMRNVHEHLIVEHFIIKVAIFLMICIVVHFVYNCPDII